MRLLRRLGCSSGRLDQRAVVGMHVRHGCRLELRELGLQREGARVAACAAGLPRPPTSAPDNDQVGLKIACDEKMAETLVQLGQFQKKADFLRKIAHIRGYGVKNTVKVG